MAGRAVLGFPSPAEDYSDDPLDLNEWLIPNPPATLLFRAEGSSMVGAGILDGDILIADSSVTPQDGDVVIASWSGNVPVCKVLRLKADRIELHSRNPQFAAIVLSPETEAEIVTVIGVVRQLHHGRPRARRSGR